MPALNLTLSPNVANPTSASVVSDFTIPNAVKERVAVSYRVLLESAYPTLKASLTGLTDGTNQTTITWSLALRS